MSDKKVEPKPLEVIPAKYAEGDAVLVGDQKAVITGTALEQMNESVAMKRVYFVRYEGQPIGPRINPQVQESAITKVK